MIDAQRSVDFVARLAEAWDGIGRNAFEPYLGTKRSLCAVAWLPLELSDGRTWQSLTEEQRRRLMLAARRHVDIGRGCAWVFGEGA